MNKRDHPDPNAKQPGVQEDSELAGRYEAPPTAHHGKIPRLSSGRCLTPIRTFSDAGTQHRKPPAGPEVAEGFHPHILHKPHKPFPIAMVNRAPRGSALIFLFVLREKRSLILRLLFCLAAPGHGDVDVPQNAAWLAGFRLAQRNIFMYFVSHDESCGS